MLGSHITTIAYPLLVLHLTGSPFAAGCAVFAATAPSVFAYIPAGALVDRWNPRRVMLMSEVGRGIAIATVAMAIAFGKPLVPLLMAVAIIEGVLEVFSVLAERRFVGSIVEPDQVSPALVLTEARTHVVLVAGRPLGGLLFGMAPIFPFVADMASFVYSVVAILLGIKDSQPTRQPTTQRGSKPGNLMAEIRQGLQWIKRDNFVRMVVVSSSIGTLIFQAQIMVFIDDARSRELSTLAIGLVLAGSGIGGALGSAIASRLLPKVGYSWMPIQAMVWVLGFFLLAFPIGQSPSVTAAIMALLGLAGALGNIALDTRLMQNADHELLARVTSVSRLSTFAACGIGPIMGGILAQEFGAQHAVLCLFAVTLVLPLLAALTPPGKSQRPAVRHTPESPPHSAPTGALSSSGPVDSERCQPIYLR